MNTNSTFSISAVQLEQAAILLQAARTRGLMLASAESCTGGRIGAALTAIAGSSDAYAGGVIAYQNSVKEKLLGVPADILHRHGAVSEPVVRAMAAGARMALGADWAVSTSGVAGPGGGSSEKPVGLVWIGIANPNQTWAFQYFFSGERNAVQSESVYTAMGLLLQLIESEQKNTCTSVQ